MQTLICDSKKISSNWNAFAWSLPSNLRTKVGWLWSLECHQQLTSQRFYFLPLQCS